MTSSAERLSAKMPSDRFEVGFDPLDAYTPVRKESIFKNDSRVDEKQRIHGDDVRGRQPMHANITTVRAVASSRIR